MDSSNFKNCDKLVAELQNREIVSSTTKKVIYIIDNIGGKTECVSKNRYAKCLKQSHYKVPPCIVIKI